MKSPIFVRTLEPAERQRLQAGLRCADAFTVRRCQILLSSANGLRSSAIARNLGCAVGTVHNAIRAFARAGLACLQEKSSRPHSARAFLDERYTDALKDLLHQSPRLFGKATSLWTLELVAEICHSRCWTPRRLTREAIRVTLKRLGIRWRRAKHWITSPDPAYARKKNSGTA
jgi:transposase